MQLFVVAGTAAPAVGTAAAPVDAAADIADHNYHRSAFLAAAAAADTQPEVETAIEIEVAGIAADTVRVGGFLAASQARRRPMRG